MFANHELCAEIPLYGTIMIVQRTDGQMIFGRVEANKRGVAVHNWTADDVAVWLEEVGLHEVDSITAALKGRGGKVLLQALELLKLEPADREELGLWLRRCFRLEMGDWEDRLRHWETELTVPGPGNGNDFLALEAARPPASLAGGTAAVAVAAAVLVGAVAVAVALLWQRPRGYSYR